MGLLGLGGLSSIVDRFSMAFLSDATAAKIICRAIHRHLWVILICISLLLLGSEFWDYLFVWFYLDVLFVTMGIFTPGWIYFV